MYEQFYGFSANPFLLTPDARFFFPSKNHKRALAFLRYGISKGEGFVVITGDVGTGKTTLVQMLLQDLENQPVSVANVVTTQLADDELIRLVAANFNLRYRELDKVDLLKGLEAYFRECARQGKRVLLIVDEAQNLLPDAIEELRMLSNFEYKGKPLLQTFLLGQDQLRNRIATIEFEQLRQRITAVFHLSPLDVDETKDYMRHRLGCVGWKDDPVISNAAYLAIHRFTGGVPRRINTVCDRILLFAFLEELHQIDEPVAEQVLQEIEAEYDSFDKVEQGNTSVPRTADTNLLKPTAKEATQARQAAANQASVGAMISPEFEQQFHTGQAALLETLQGIRTALENLHIEVSRFNEPAQSAPASRTATEKTSEDVEKASPKGLEAAVKAFSKQ